MASTNRNDPFSAFNFLVEIDGNTQAAFMEVKGLEVTIDVIEYREGADKLLTVRKLPGLAKYSNITFKRGYTQDRTLWNWIKTVIDGNAHRATVAITLLDDKHQPALKWIVHEAWPCKYEGPDLNGKSSDIAIESLELCHEGFELAQ